MIKAYLIGDPNRVPEYIRSKFPEVQTACRVSMARLVLKLTRKIKQEKLSGQVLRARPPGGHLRRSIHPEISGSDTSVIGTVGTNVEYAAIHEYGFNGIENVRAHLRRIKSQRLILKSGKYSKRSWAVPKSQGMVQVRAHERHMVMPERSFMRTALNEMKPEILAEFEKAIMDVIRKP